LTKVIIQALSTDPRVSEEFATKVTELQSRLSKQGLNHRDWDTFTDKQQAIFTTDLFLDGESARSVDDYARIGYTSCSGSGTQDDLEFHSPRLLDKIRKAQQAKPSIQIEGLLDTLIEQVLLNESSKGIAHDDKMGKYIINDSGDRLRLVAHAIIEISPDDPDSLKLQVAELAGEEVELEAVIGAPNSKAIVILAEDPKGRRVGFVRYTTSRLWTQTGFGKDTGWTIAGTASSVEKLPLKPSDLVTLDQLVPPSSVPGIVGTAANAHKLDPIIADSLVSNLESILAKTGISTINFPDEESRDQAIPALTKYYAEIVAPMLLAAENSSLGPANTISDSVEKLLNPNGIGGYSQATAISWPSSVTNALVDSHLHFGADFKIGISSKAQRGGGANPSISSLLGLFDAYDPAEVRNLFSGSAALERLYLALKAIAKLPSRVGPIRAAFDLKLIKSKEFEALTSIYAAPRSAINDGDPFDFVSEKYFKDKTSRYFPVAQKNLNSSRYDPYFHLLGALARQVEEHVNEAKTEQGKHAFTELAKIAYSQGSLVQIYGDFSRGATNESGESSAIMKPFKFIYPARFDGEIRLDAGKNYMTTYVNGRLTVNIRH